MKKYKVFRFANWIEKDGIFSYFLHSKEIPVLFKRMRVVEKGSKEVVYRERIPIDIAHKVTRECKSDLKKKVDKLKQSYTVLGPVLNASYTKDVEEKKDNAWRNKK